MGNGVDEAAVDQRKTRRRKTRIGGRAVRTVAVLIERRGAVLFEIFSIGERNGNLHAVARQRPHAFGLVVGRIVAAEHLVALAQRAFAGLHVEVVDGVRRDQRGEVVAQRVGVLLAVVAERGGVVGVVGLDEEI